MNDWISIEEDGKPSFDVYVNVSDGEDISTGYITSGGDWVIFEELDIVVTLWQDMPELPKKRNRHNEPM